MDDGGWGRGREGDTDAFISLFRRHTKSIYNFCFRRTADWALAEDLTSVVFLEAWRRREDVRLASEDVLPWLYGVATNVVRNHKRSSRRAAALQERLSPDGPPDFSDDLIERLDAERQMRTLLELIQQLPARQQDVLVLCLWQGLTYEQAAIALGLPLGTVRSRLARAKARIRWLGATQGNSAGSKPPMTQDAEVDRG